MRRWGIFVAVLLGAVLGACQTKISVEDAPETDIWGGQRFMIARLYIDNSSSSTKYVLSSVTVRNAETRLPLDGAFLEKIEVVRPSDGRTLGTLTQLQNFATSGVTITLSPQHETPAYAQSVLEIWITLKDSTDENPLPPGRIIVLGVTGVQSPATLELPASRSHFKVGDPNPGLNFVEPSRLEDGAVFGGLSFVALRFRLVDNDPDPYPVKLKSVRIRNVADSRTILADSYVTGIEIVRTIDGKVLGRVSNKNGLPGLSAGGVSVSLGGTGVTPADLTIIDDTDLELEVRVTLATQVPEGRTLRLSAVVFHSEGGIAYYSERMEVTGPTFTTRSAGGLVGTDITPRGNWIFAGLTSLVQKIKLEPRYPGDPNTVLLTSIVIKNVSPTDPVTDAHVSKIEVKTEEGTLVASTTSISGLRSDSGLSMSCNYQVQAGASVVLEIYFTLKSDVPVNRKLRAETEVKHSSGGQNFTTGPVRSAVEFTSAVDYPPQVDFTWTPTTPKWNETVTFTPNVSDDSRDPVGRDPIVYSRWDFGDGQKVERNGPPEQVRHTYNKGGKFTVTLLVRDDKGVEGQKSKEITLSNLAPTGVDFSWDPKTPKWSDTIAFTPDRNITDPDGDIRQATFSWNFGDGKTLETRGPETVRYSYGKGGEFMVTLTITDAGGASASKSYKLTISNEPPKNVDFSFSPEKPKWREEVTFTPAREITDPDGDIAKAIFRWDLGDGTTKETTGPQSITHTYEKFDDFKVTLTVVDQGGASATKIRTLTVEAPTVDFSWQPEQPKTGEEVTFTAQPEPNEYGFGYRWDFGDGTIWPARDQPPAPTNQATHTYRLAPAETEKKFTVTLTVTDRDGKTVGTKSKEITVIRVVNKPPTVTRISPTPSQPKPGEEITFTATATDPEGDAIIEWQWDFGDGSPVRTTTAGTTKYTYQKENLYTVKVRAKDAGSNEYGAWFSINLYVGAAPIGVRVLDNPASNQCRIQIFAPANAQDLKITILDQAGRPVLLEKPVTIGTFTWDLKDRDGRVVPNGLYLFYVTGKIGDKIERSEIGRILVRR